MHLVKGIWSTSLMSNSLEVWQHSHRISNFTIWIWEVKRFTVVFVPWIFWVFWCPLSIMSDKLILKDVSICFGLAEHWLILFGMVHHGYVGILYCVPLTTPCIKYISLCFIANGRYATCSWTLVGEQWIEKRIYIFKENCVASTQDELCGHSTLDTEGS